MKLRALAFIVILSILGCDDKDDDFIIPDPPIDSSQSEFTLVTEGNTDEKGNDLLLLQDGLLLFGTKQDANALGNLWLMKRAFNGEVIWEREWMSGPSDEAVRVLQVDNFFYLVSRTTQLNGNTDIQLSKADLSGNVIWRKVYGDSLADFPNDLIRLKNNQLLIAGGTENYGANGTDIFLLWVNLDGDSLHSKRIGAADSDGSSRVIQNLDGEIVLHGYTHYLFGSTDRNLILHGMDSNGDSLWSQVYGGSGYEESQGFDVHQNGYLINAHSASKDPLHNMITYKTDRRGNILWEREFGGVMHDGGTAALVSSPTTYALVGRSMSFGGADREVYFVKVKNDGTVISESNIGGEKDDWIVDIVLHNGYYYLLGHSNSYTLNNAMYFVKRKA